MQLPRPVSLTLFCIALLTLIVLPVAAETYAYAGEFASGGGAIAIDAAGTVYIPEENSVRKFSTNGTFLSQWGSEGPGDDQFIDPGGIAIDSVGNVYIADNDSIKKFTSDGAFLGALSSPGAGTYYSGCLAIGPADTVYVAEYSTVRTFSSNGTPLGTWGSEGSDDGQFKGMGGIAVDGAGHVYISDVINSRVQKLASDGTFIAKWGTKGSRFGQFSWPMNLAVDPSGNICVVDQGNHRVQKFAPDGTFITAWGSLGDGDGQFRETDGIAVSGAGVVYVGDEHRGRVQIFQAQAGMPTPIPTVAPGGEAYVLDRVWTEGPHFSYNGGIGIDATGTIFVADYDGSCVWKYSSNGTYLAKWGSYGTGDGQFKGPRNVDIDAAGDVYVLDRGNARVQKFTSNGTFIKTWGGSGTADGNFTSPVGLAVDDTGNVYVSDTYNHRVQKFTSDGTLITTWGGRGSEDGQLSYPWGVGVDGAGNVYVADTGNYRVQKFNSTGAYLAKWGSQGPDPGEFEMNRGIAVDSAGYVYVADGWYGRFQKFTPDGTLVTQWACDGHEDLAVDSRGFVYTTDTFNQLEVFAHVTAPPTASFSVNATSGAEPLAVRFTDTSSGYPDYWAWDFGDSATTTGERNPVHVYTAPGTYTVRLTAENPMGSTTAETTVTVESGIEIPVANFTWMPGNPVTGQPVTFTDQSVNDPTARSWWVNNTPLFSGVDGVGRPLGTFTSPELVYTFTTPGETNITMVAANDAGDSAPITKIVTVDGLTIDPAFVTPPSLTVEPGENLTVPVVLSVVPNGLVGCGFTVRLEDAGLAEVVGVSFPPGIDGDFNGWNGAGHTDLPAPGVEVWPFMSLDPKYWTSVALGNVTIRGLASGSTKVRYSGYYNDGFYSDNVFVPVTYSTLTVGDVATPPVANFTANVTTGTAPLTVQFTDTSVGTPAGWAWIFGDGGTSAEQHPVHTFTAAGTYTVSLNATNDGGSDTSVQEGLIVVASAIEQLPGALNLPTDLNGDGKFDDVNGNARADFADVVLYFNQMTWIAANEPVALFDYNGNGRIDFADVVWLFNHL